MPWLACVFLRPTSQAGGQLADDRPGRAATQQAVCHSAYFALAMLPKEQTVTTPQFLPDVVMRPAAVSYCRPLWLLSGRSVWQKTTRSSQLSTTTRAHCKTACASWPTADAAAAAMWAWLPRLLDPWQRVQHIGAQQCLWRGMGHKRAWPEVPRAFTRAGGGLLFWLGLLGPRHLAVSWGAANVICLSYTLGHMQV